MRDHNNVHTLQYAAVETGNAWSFRAIAIGLLVGGCSSTAWVGLDKANELLQYQMPDAVFLPLLCIFVLVFPLGTVVAVGSRLFSFMTTLIYSLGIGIGMYTAFEVDQFLEFGLWKGYLPSEHSLSALIVRHVSSALIFIIAATTGASLIWLMRRLIQGISRQYRDRNVVMNDGRRKHAAEE